MICNMISQKFFKFNFNLLIKMNQKKFLRFHKQHI